MRFSPLLLWLLLPAQAQEIRIRLRPPKLSPSKEAKGERGQKKDPDGGVAEGEAQGEPASLKAKPTPLKEGAASPRKNRRRASPKDPSLRGTGGVGKQTRWGVVETVTPYEAALQRGAFAGEELEFNQRVHFHLNSLRFTRASQSALKAIGARIQSTPEIQLLLIEGHTDARGSLGYNQKLSEARASAIREALVRYGVAPERLLAYGLGETRPEARKYGQNRRVIFRMVQGDRAALQERQALQWGRAAVVGLWGDPEWAERPEESGSRRSWSPLSFRDELEEGIDIRTGPGGRLLLRLPDLSRLLLEEESVLSLGKLFYDPEAQKSYVAIQLRRGRLWILANPQGRPQSRSLYAFRGGSLSLKQARLQLQVDHEGLGWVELDSGQAQVATGEARSFSLRKGERLFLGAKEESMQRLPAPHNLQPAEGCEHELSWSTVEGAQGYQILFALDVSLLRRIKLERTQENSLKLKTAPQKALYWQVRAEEEEGLGMPSSIHLLCPEPEKAHEEQR